MENHIPNGDWLNKKKTYSWFILLNSRRKMKAFLIYDFNSYHKIDYNTVLYMHSLKDRKKIKKLNNLNPILINKYAATGWGI